MNIKRGQALRFHKATVPFSRIGGDEGDRTPGLGVANAALSQLSYIPIFLNKNGVVTNSPAVSGGAYMIRGEPVKG